MRMHVAPLYIHTHVRTSSNPKQIQILQNSTQDQAAEASATNNHGSNGRWEGVHGSNMLVPPGEEEVLYLST